MEMIIPLVAPGVAMAVRPGVVALVSGEGSLEGADNPPSPTITVSASSSVIQGKAIALVGQWTMYADSALDYSTDGESTWTPMTGYASSSDGTWKGNGPVASAAGALTISVREHNRPQIKASVSLTVDTPDTTGATALSLQPFPDLSILQREPGGDSIQSNVPFRFTYSGTPGRLQGRVLRGASVVVDWTDLTGFSGDGTNGFAVLVGVPPGDGYTRVIQDAVSGVTSTDTVSTWGAGGVRVMFAGQDDQQGVLTHSEQASGVDANALAAYNTSPKLNRIYDGAGWHVLKNGITYPATGVGQGYLTTGSAGTVHVSRLIQDFLGSAPSSLTPFVRTNTLIEDWLPGGAYKGLAYDSSGDGVTAGAGFQSAIWTNLNDAPGVGYGDLEAVCWYQGAANAATATATSYGTSLDALYQQFIGWVSPQGRDGTTFIFVPVIIHGLASGGANSEYIRKSIMDFVARHQDAGHKVSFVSALDLPTVTGGVHLGIDGQVTMGCRQVQALLYQTGQSSISGMGPKIIDAQRSGTSVSITIESDGGSIVRTANGGPPTGFYISTDNFFTGVGPGTGSYVTPSAVAITDDHTITITLPSTPVGPIYLKYQGGTPGTTAFYNGVNNASTNPDVTGAVRDDVALPTDSLLDVWHAPLLGFPLQPLLNSIVIS